MPDMARREGAAGEALEEQTEPGEDCKLPQGLRAGLHDNVPDRPSTKVAPVGRQLVTMAFTIKTVTIQKVGCMAEVVTQSGTSVHLG